MNGPVPVGGRFGIVRNHQNGLAEPRVQIAQYFEHGARGGRIQVPGGFIRQKNRGVIHNRARNRHSLLFATREFTRPMFEAPGNSE